MKFTYERDSFQTGVNSEQYKSNFDRIFRKKDAEATRDVPLCPTTTDEQPRETKQSR